MKKLVIFDLDGTLLDTIADLAISTNHALEQYGFPVHPIGAYRFFVGNGIDRLMERALPEGARTPENIFLIRTAFLAYYAHHRMDMSKPYPGIPMLLAALEQRGIQLAVASNKYHEATCELIQLFFPTIPFIKVLGQREGVPPKPDPTIVFEILQVAGVAPEDVLYVGDSGVDMQTAINSDVALCAVTWGFRPLSELEAYHPDYIVDQPEDILSILND